MFPLRIERWGLKYWYLLILLPYAVVFVLTVVTGYLDTSLEVAKKEGFYNLVEGVTTRTRVWAHIREEFLLDITFNSTGLGLLLAGSAFVAWQANLRRLFETVLETISSKRSGGDEDLNTSFHDFLKDYQAKLDNRKRYVFVLGMTILTLLPAIYNPDFFERPENTARWVWYFEELIKWCGAWLVWAYCLGVCGWVTYVTASSISRLPVRFEFTLRPGHPDQSGGLKPVGQFCLLMVSPILISILYLSVFGILPSIASQGFQRITPKDPLVVFNNLALFLIAIPLATAVFFKTLWRFHKTMLHKRREYEIRQYRLFQNCLDELRSNIKRDDVVAAKISSEKLDLIRKMDPDNIGFPVWPFNRQILVRFATPQILSIIGYLVLFIRGRT